MFIQPATNQQHDPYSTPYPNLNRVQNPPASLSVPSQIIQLSRKQVLYHAGDNASSLYRLHSGLIRIIRSTPDGRLMTLRHIMPGDFFGEEALRHSSMMPAKRFEIAEALTKVEVEAIDPSTISATDTLSINHSIAQQIQRLADYQYHLQTGDLRQRVARYLVQLAQTALAVQNDAGQIMVAATHELLAEGTSSTRESVSKIITDLRNEGLIASGYRSIVLLDWHTLVDLAEELY